MYGGGTLERQTPNIEDSHGLSGTLCAVNQELENTDFMLQDCMHKINGPTYDSKKYRSIDFYKLVE